MSEAALPKIRMPEKALCRQHYGELIPEHHPSGVLWQTRYSVAMIEFMHEAFANPEFARRVGGKTEMINAILQQSCPLCCFLGSAARIRVAEKIDDAIQRILTARQNKGETA